MSEIDGFLRSARAELADVCRPLSALVDQSAGNALLVAVTRIEDRIAPLHRESLGYRCDVATAGSRALLTALDAIRQREIDRMVSP
jgi:hypothetical protein